MRGSRASSWRRERRHHTELHNLSGAESGAGNLSGAQRPELICGFFYTCMILIRAKKRPVVFCLWSVVSRGKLTEQLGAGRAPRAAQGGVES